MPAIAIEDDSLRNLDDEKNAEEIVDKRKSVAVLLRDPDLGIAFTQFYFRNNLVDRVPKRARAGMDACCDHQTTLIIFAVVLIVFVCLQLINYRPSRLAPIAITIVLIVLIIVGIVTRSSLCMLIVLIVLVISIIIQIVVLILTIFRADGFTMKLLVDIILAVLAIVVTIIIAISANGLRQAYQ